VLQQPPSHSGIGGGEHTHPVATITEEYSKQNSGDSDLPHMETRQPTQQSVGSSNGAILHVRQQEEQQLQHSQEDPNNNTRLDPREQTQQVGNSTREWVRSQGSLEPAQQQTHDPTFLQHQRRHQSQVQQQRQQQETHNQQQQLADQQEAYQHSYPSDLPLSTNLPQEPEHRPHHAALPDAPSPRGASEARSQSQNPMFKAPLTPDKHLSQAADGKYTILISPIHVGVEFADKKDTAEVRSIDLNDLKQQLRTASTQRAACAERREKLNTLRAQLLVNGIEDMRPKRGHAASLHRLEECIEMNEAADKNAKASCQTLMRRVEAYRCAVIN
jgi:hypothetical protein